MFEPFSRVSAHNRLLMEDLANVKALLLNQSQSLELRKGAATVVACSNLDDAEKAALLLKVLDEGNEELSAEVVFSLCMVSHPMVFSSLRILARAGSPSVQLRALNSLARLKDPEIYDICCEFICHRTPEHRKAAIMALTALKDGRSLSLLELLWNSRGLTEEERKATACILAHFDNHLGEEFLEKEFTKNQETDLNIVVALARLRNYQGLQAIKGLLAEKGEVECRRMKLLLFHYLGIDPYTDFGNWKDRVLAYVEERLREKNQ